MENPMKLILLAVVALMILGPQRFAGIGSTLGRTIRDFRNALRSAQDEARQTFSESLPDGASGHDAGISASAPRTRSDGGDPARADVRQCPRGREPPRP